MRFFIVAVFTSVVAVASCYEDTFAGIPLDELPNPENRPVMARFIVNNANWTSFAYITKKCSDGRGCPGNILLATSDGKYGCGTGIPYFWASRHHPEVNDLLDDDPRGNILFTLAQTPICREKSWDPQDPRCAHITVAGDFHKIDEKDSEFAVGKEALFGRHPQFGYYPSGHNFFIAKFNISSIGIISKFGGPVDVDLKQYYEVKC